jgi:cytochrome d ubiquinol oxidase subunit II
VSPEIFARFPDSFLAWLFFLVHLAGLAAVFYGLAKGRDLLAFLGSGAFILGLLATTAACVWPVMLKSTLDPALSLTALNAGAGAHGLRAGLGWWFLGFPIAVGYVAVLFRIHRGKVGAVEDAGY